MVVGKFVNIRAITESVHFNKYLTPTKAESRSLLRSVKSDKMLIVKNSIGQDG